MIRILNDNRKLLYDGFEHGFYDDRFVIHEMERYYFSARDLDDFKHLESRVSGGCFEQLREAFDIEEKALADIKHYKKENLGVGYFIKNGKLFLISDGEWQPGRYVIYFEGVVDLKSCL